MDIEFHKPVIAEKGSYNLSLVSVNSRKTLLRLGHNEWDQAPIQEGFDVLTVEEWREELAMNVAEVIAEDRNVKGIEAVKRIMDSGEKLRPFWKLYQNRCNVVPDPNLIRIEGLRPVCEIAEDKANALCPGEQTSVVSIRPSVESDWWHPLLFGGLSVVVWTEGSWRRLSAVARCIVDTLHEMAPEGKPGFDAEAARADMRRRFEDALLEGARDE